MVNDKKTAEPNESPGVDKPARPKVKRPKQPGKQKPAKKRKCEGPTCSMLMTELSKKITAKKKQQEEKNIVQTIIDSITNALPVRFSKRIPLKKESPIDIETLQALAPELIPRDTVEMKVIKPDTVKELENTESIVVEPDTNIPRMPIVDSKDMMKITARSKHDTVVEDVSLNTDESPDVASEISKHVSTLKKISLIAEEFNQKTAKNLKEIVESVQLDLLRKLEEVQAMESRALKPVAPAQSVPAYRDAPSRPPSPPISLPPLSN